MKETVRYVGPDGEALHPGDRIGLEPPGCLKRDDGLDAWLTALRHEMARDCELPEKVILKGENQKPSEVFESCKIAAKRVVNPIVDWPDKQVWSFLQDAKVPVNPLYECGVSRVGCIGCLLARKSKRYDEFRRWPAYEKLYIQAFDRMLDERRKRGKMDGNWMMGGTGQDVFRWWMEEDVLPGQISVGDILEN